MILIQNTPAGHCFTLHTEGTTYAFWVTESGHLEHLYYGPRLHRIEGLLETQRLKSAFGPGNTIAYSEDHPALTLEVLPQETGTRGKGDYREPMVATCDHLGRRSSDLLYCSHQLHPGLGPMPALEPGQALAMPHLGDTPDPVETLEILLKDGVQGTAYHLYYTVFYAANTIGRRMVLENTSPGPLIVEKLMSAQLDLPHSAFTLTHFTGAWAREMQRGSMPLSGGLHQLGSTTGTSSNRTNPLFLLHAPKATETSGHCYGFNLVYSGNCQATVEVGAFGSTRVLQGVRPDSLATTLAPGASLATPLAVLTFSDQGFGGISRHLHGFTRHHIVRGPWQYRVRPVLINSWEAFYFDVNKDRLLQLAKRAKTLGVELFVLDDGWFGNRDSDQRGLGDWQCNLKKLPGGLKPLAEQINHLGMDFGIWVEPEMANPDSDLYRAHPEWFFEIPGIRQSLGRHQLLLDLGLPAVQDYLFEALRAILDSAPISYVKWDMNRNMTDVYSKLSPQTPEGQGALSHRYVLGLYGLLSRLTQAFPQVLFEGCASGGNRFDLGMLCYMPQIWASDNTDAHSRVALQTGYSLGYPPSTMGAHVSDVPNHQTLRLTPLATRQTVASFGLLGYELNLAHQSVSDLKAMGAHIDFYKQWRRVLQFGDFYRLEADDFPELRESTGWMSVSQDRRQAVVGLIQGLYTPNQPELRLPLRGLNPELIYRVRQLPVQHSLSTFGDLVNAVSPIKLPKDSLRLKLAERLYPVPGEQLELVASGAVLLQGGIRLHQGFMGMGYNEQVRLYPDFAARLFVLEALDN